MFIKVFKVCFYHISMKEKEIKKEMKRWKKISYALLIGFAVVAFW